MKKGDKIVLVVGTPFAKVEEDGIVEKVTKEHIYIKGLDIPFDAKTGKKTYCFPGSSCYIKDYKKK